MLPTILLLRARQNAARRRVGAPLDIVGVGMYIPHSFDNLTFVVVATILHAQSRGNDDQAILQLWDG